VFEVRHTKERERAARNDPGQAEEQKQLEREEEGQDEAALRAHHLELPREEGGREGRKEYCKGKGKEPTTNVMRGRKKEQKKSENTNS
jgi:hypothetical protein